MHPWLLRHQRFKLHFTPAHRSWLNQAERWFGALTDRQLRRGSHRSKFELRHAIESFVSNTNQNPKPFVWVKTADDILASIARFAQRTIEVHNSQGTSVPGH